MSVQLAISPGRVSVPKMIRTLSRPVDTSVEPLRQPSDYKRLAAHSPDTTTIGRVHGFNQTLFDMVLQLTQAQKSLTLHPNYPPDPFKNISGDLPMGPGRVSLLA